MRRNGKTIDAGGRARHPVMSGPRKKPHYQQPRSGETRLREERDQLKALVKGYARLFHSAPVGCISLDRRGRIFNANATCQRLLLPRQRQGLRGRDFNTFVEPSDRPALRRFLRNVFSSGRRQTCEIRLSGLRGSFVYVRLEAWLDTREAVCRLVLTNITERKEVEQALVVAKERLEFAHTAAGAGTWDWDMTTGRLEWSDHLFDLFGLNPRNASASLETWHRVLHPEDRDRATARLQSALSERRDLVNEYRIVRPNGQVRWIRALGRAAYNDQGKPIRMAGLCIDITEQNRAEKALRDAHSQLEHRVEGRTAELRQANDALRDSQAILQGFYNSAPFLMGVVELVGRRIVLVSGNAVVARILGCKPEELPDRSGRALSDSPEQHRLWFRNYQQCLRQGAPVRFDYEYSTPEDERWHRATVALLGHGPRGFPRFSFVVEDITEQKRSERFLIAQRDLSEKLASMDAIEPAAAHLLEVATQLYGLDSGGLYLTDPGSGHLKLAAHRGLSADFVEQVRSLPPDSPQVRLVMEGVPVFGSLAELPPLVADSCRAEGLRALAVIPIRHDGRLIGVLNIASHQHDEIPHPARLAIQSLAAQAAGAILRIQTEVARRQSDQRLRAIIENTPIIVFSGNRDCILTFEDGRALQDLGFKPGQNVGRSVFEVYSGSSTIADSVRRVLSGDEVSKLIEFGHINFETWYTPLRDEAGHVNGFFGIATNVTDRVRLERQIVEISDRVQASFGQELHDGLCQVLVGLAFDTNGLQKRLADVAPAEQHVLARICGLLDDAITDARRLSRGLFPVKLENYGLAAALRDLTESLGRHARLATRFEEVGGPVLVTNHVAAIHLFRIAQEAMNNAVRHARPRRLSVQLNQAPQVLSLSITDDGCGIPVDRSKLTGLGLHIMDYRARALGGTLRLRNRPQRGTEVLCEVPWPLSGPEASRLQSAPPLAHGPLQI